MRVAEHALRRPVTVLVMVAAIMVLGTVSLTRLKSEFLPKVDFPFIGVWAPYPNAVPAQVEKEIARPIEEIFATLGDVRSIDSYSDEDGAWIQVRFDFGRSVDVLRMEVKEKLEHVRPLLPADLRETYIFSFNSNDIPIMVGRISARGRDLSNSYDLLERRIINPLRRVEGVGRVVVDGIAPKSIAIHLYLDRIVEHSVDVERLFTLLNSNNIDLSVGRVQNGRQRIAVRALGQFRSLEDLENLQVTAAGVRLKDVAEIVHAEPRAPSADTHERIRRSHIGPTDRDRMKGAVGQLQGDSILPPKLLGDHESERLTSKRMKGVGQPNLWCIVSIRCI